MTDREPSHPALVLAGIDRLEGNLTSGSSTWFIICQGINRFASGAQWICSEPDYYCITCPNKNKGERYFY